MVRHFRDVHERAQADLVGLRQSFQPGFDEDAILARQRHEVRHRADGHEIEMLAQLDFVPQRSVAFHQRVREFEGDADAGEGCCTCETFSRLSFAAAKQFRGDNLRIHQRHTVRQLCRRFVVIEHDGVHTTPLQPGNLFRGTRAAVHGHEQLRPVLLQTTPDAFGAQSVPFIHPVREEIFDRRARRPQHAQQQRARRYAVHVVVAVNDDALLAFDGVADPIHRRRHVRQLERVAKLAQLRIEKVFRSGNIAVAAIDEDLGQRRRDVKFAENGFDQRRLGRGDDPAFWLRVHFAGTNVIRDRSRLQIAPTTASWSRLGGLGFFHGSRFRLRAFAAVIPEHARAGDVDG